MPAKAFLGRFRGLFEMTSSPNRLLVRIGSEDLWYFWRYLITLCRLSVLPKALVLAASIPNKISAPSRALCIANGSTLRRQIRALRSFSVSADS
jgi:hypothetical protein